jgi:hypothetical protein
MSKESCPVSAAGLWATRLLAFALLRAAVDPTLPTGAFSAGS